MRKEILEKGKRGKGEGGTESQTQTQTQDRQGDKISAKGEE